MVFLKVDYQTDSLDSYALEAVNRAGWLGAVILACAATQADSGTSNDTSKESASGGGLSCDILLHLRNTQEGPQFQPGIERYGKRNRDPERTHQ